MPGSLDALALAELGEAGRERQQIFQRQQQPMRPVGIGRPAVETGIELVEPVRVELGELAASATSI